MADMTAADLTGHHVGRTIRVHGEQGDVAGVLVTAKHDRGYASDGPPPIRTWLHVDCGAGMKWMQQVAGTTTVSVELAHLAGGSDG